MAEHYDILIVGGGMVGASLACALAPLSLKTGIVERFEARDVKQASFDDRSIALAYGSRKIFQSMGLWSALSEVVTPINKIHISDRGHFGATRLDSHSMDVDALGYVIESRDLGKVLQQQLKQQSQLDRISPAEVQSIEIVPGQANVSVIQGGEQRQLSATLVIAADGSDSLIRQQLDIESTLWEYGQTALIANVGTSVDHQNIAYERFTDSGPLAMLPMQAARIDGEEISRSSLVWTLRDDQVETHMNLSDEQFLKKLQQRFGHRLGEMLHAGKRQTYPLRLLKAANHVHERVALIGNAAHTLHPVAGQGFNLGIRDVAVLADVISSALDNGQDIGDIQVLNQYVQWRQRDHKRVIAFTDSMVRIFSNPLWPVQKVRGLALTLLDVVPPLKKQLARQTMGLAGRLPRLARGLGIK